MSAGEDFTLAIGDAVVPVVVMRHHAARRMRLRWDAVAATLRLTLPPRAGIRAARAWVEEQRAWVERQRRAAPEGRLPVMHGAVLPWGEGALTVDWQAAAARQPRLADERLIVGGPEATVGRRVGRWLAARALEDFGARAHAMAATAALPLAGVAVGDARRRWGSCSSSRQLRFSWRLALAPDYVRHALVAHEVAHLAHMDHSARFRALETRLGGEAVGASRVWLRAHGATLHRLDFS